MSIPIKIQLPKDFLDEEIRDGYAVSASKKRIWAVLLDLLIEFDNVCKRNNIKYFLDSGTLLGAVRHKGFIPWDDDIDVILLRDDYDKLCAIATDEFRHPYFWQTNHTDIGSAFGHGQLRNSLTTNILVAETIGGKPVFHHNQGIFLDVFILDAIPDNESELDTFRLEILHHKQYIFRLKNILYKHWKWERNLLNIHWIFHCLKKSLWTVRELFSTSPLLEIAYNNYEKDLTKYRNCKTRRVANFAINPMRKSNQLFNRNLYGEPSYYQFEGYKLPGPRDYETVLSAFYGDWRKPTPEPSGHGGVISNPEVPWTAYLNRDITNRYYANV